MANLKSTIPFTKMHGIGNDYIYIDCLETMPENPAGLSIEMSTRHTSIGSDGIILICPSKIADFKMRIFNADGSERLCVATAADAWENMYMTITLPTKQK